MVFYTLMTLCWVMLGYLFYLDTKQNHAKPMIKHLNILKVEGMFQTTHSFDDFDPRILPGSKNRSCRYRQLCSNETGATCALRHYDAICTPVIVAGRALGLMNVGMKKLGFSMKPASFFFFGFEHRAIGFGQNHATYGTMEPARCWGM
jgi:hypothetical protein